MWFRQVIFIACIFSITNSFSQSDSLFIPKLTIKASLGPLFIFSPVNNADIGFESRLSNKYTIGLYLGKRYLSPRNKNPETDLKAGYINFQLKRYLKNIKNKSYYFCLDYTYDNSISHPIVNFNVDSIYYKQITLYSNLNSLQFRFGIQSMGKKVKFPLDAGLGFGLGLRNMTSKNLSAGEVKFLEDGRASELDLQKAGTRIIPVVSLSLRIGLVAIR